MWSILPSTIFLLLVFKSRSVFAALCQNERISWQCACGCCEEYDYCCTSCASYWYAWLIMTLLFFACLCGCLGCGSYGYYRRYRTPYNMSSLPPSYVQPQSTYETANLNTPTNNSRPYAAMSTTNNRNQVVHVGYHGNQYVPQELPPPYNPSQPPPPYYSTH